MSADNMPPLPELSFLGDDRSYGYDAEDMHAYARAYAAEQTRELVEALEWFTRFQALPHETDNERFERVAETFRAETGYLAPGKDCRFHDHEERRDAWEMWMRTGVERARALIAKHKGAA